MSKKRYPGRYPTPEKYPLSRAQAPNLIWRETLYTCYQFLHRIEGCTCLEDSQACLYCQIVFVLNNPQATQVEYQNYFRSGMIALENNEEAREIILACQLWDQLKKIL